MDLALCKVKKKKNWEGAWIIVETRKRGRRGKQVTRKQLKQHQLNFIQHDGRGC